MGNLQSTGIALIVLAAFLIVFSALVFTSPKTEGNLRMAVALFLFLGILMLVVGLILRFGKF